MCGIVGIISSRAPVLEKLQSMLSAIQHRGPDDEGVYVGKGVILGQRRLSIIDLDGGRQPIPNEDNTLWIVCNGEIYNYRELREELKAKGHRFSTHSDSEVILHLYEEMGERCVERLRGMFAFVLWDEKQKTLFAARDRLGQKPFYFVQCNQELFFASEIKALLALDSSLAEMDLEALDQYMTLRLIAPPRSMFRRIKKLAPAHSLRFSIDKGLNIHRYWDLHYEPKLVGTDEALVDELEEKLIDCLKLHMVSDVPVGAFMSGGLDSTLVVAMLMKHVVSEPIHTFSMGLPYKKFDEAPYARLVAQQYGTCHHEKVVVPSLLEILPCLVWHLDEPSDPLSLCSYLIAQMASEHVKVVLGGDGGDELFGGYDRYYGNRYAGYYSLLPWFLRRHVVGSLFKIIPEGRWYKSRAHQLKWLHRLSFAKGGARYAMSLDYFYFSDKERQELYGPSMSIEGKSFDPHAGIRDYYDQANAVNSVDRMLYADSQIRLPDHPVMILDRMTMAHGLEARAPFMDHTLAEFAAKLPSRLKVRGRSLRYIQMRLAERYLPREVLNRPKQGFSVALPYMLDTEYRLLFKLFLQQSELAQNGFFRQIKINKLLSEHERKSNDHGSRLWLLLNAEVWYRMFIQGNSKENLLEEIRNATSDVVKEKAYA
ncbi:asparagine synthase (glutamine-hydrolyzing) [Nitrosococcus wardiae]|uniref:asparagine synthase (glutamine-hydrolyzing) n=1 Tax=Nitrosococcus wardiae TaxID=1814290 RepID=A0A4P7BYT1_9GAMM|nr:asparagine synthase (glutamine-hydrolyzing) [Nitrosococcus wardiae]QBQ54409.1 asparagine synthase (glutamine-hydrolyzing) [Nitrosococcus wardiae]